MGNSKEARYNGGGSTMNPTAAVHLDMTSEMVASSSGRTFRTSLGGTVRSSGVRPVVRRSLSNAERRRYSSSKGAVDPTKETAEEAAAPKYDPQYVCFKAETPTYSGGDSYFDQAPMTPRSYQYWVPSKGLLGAWGDLHVDLSNIHVVPDPSYAQVYTHADNPFAMRATFDPLGHAKIAMPYSAPLFRSTVGGFSRTEPGVAAFAQTSKVVLKDLTSINMTIVPDPRGSGAVAPEYVDMSFDYSALPPATAAKFRDNSKPFLVSTEIKQKNLKDKAVLTQKTLPLDDARRITTYDNSANHANGLFVFKPPTKIVASELYNGLHTVGGRDVSDVNPVGGPGKGAIDGLTGNLLSSDAGTMPKLTNGVKLYLDSPLPNNSSKMVGPKKVYDWFDIKFRPTTGGGYTDVSNLTLEQSSATSGYDKIGFDICNHDLTSILELHATVALPASVKVLAGADRKTDVSFTADLTSNMLISNKQPIVRAVNLRLYHGGSSTFKPIWP